MELRAVRVQNFRSFKALQELVFPAGGGLYFMRGDNREEPRLEANGAGKSTLWEALCWCAFGKTSRGLKAGEVCNWGAPKGPVVVEVDFANATGDHTLRRTWGPISFTLDGVDITKTTDKHLGLDFVPFLQCVLMAQSQPMFLDLKADAKAALFGEVLGLDVWLQRSQDAGRLAGEQDKETRRLEREVSGLQGRLEAGARADFAALRAEWESAHAKKLKQLEAEYTQALDEEQRLDAGLEAASKKLAGLKKPAPSLDMHVRQAREQHAAAREVLAAVRADASAAAARFAALEESRICPTCGTDCDTTVLRRLQRVHVGADEALMHAEDAVRDALEWLERMEGEQRQSDKAYTASLQQYESAEDTVRAAKRAMDVQGAQLDRMENEFEVLSAEKNPYAALEAEAAREREATAQQLRAVQAVLDASIERYSLLSLWVKGFKDVRLQEISSALHQLEIEVNSALAALGLLDWEILFDIDRETKGGSVQRGFAVTVTSPHNDRPVPWEAWSGGEGQRLRIAGNVGLADLIRAQTAETLDLEVWDEPTAGLSAQGVRDLLDMLAERAASEGRQIWVVDHRSLDYGGFTGEVVVVKDSDGSRFEWRA